MTVYRNVTSRSSGCHFKRVLAVIFGCLLVNGALFSVLYRHWEYQKIISTLERERDLNFEILHREEIVISRELQSPAWILIEETRAAIAAAGGVPGTILSAEEKKAWDTRNPCAGRHRLSRLWNREKLTSGGRDSTASIAEPSVLLYALFEEYANLHRTCTHGGDVKYVTEQYKLGNISSPCKFVIVEFGSYGIGNRMLWLISAFQFALLTKRVLLIDTRSTIHSLLCEPFPGSSWLLPDDFDYSSELRWPMPLEFQEKWDGWESKESLAKEKAADEKSRERNALQKWDKMMDSQDLQERRETLASVLSKIQAEADRNVLAMESTEKLFGNARQLNKDEEPQPTFFRVQGNDGWAPNPRFFCETEQQRLRKVNWISMNSGCLYFLPDLFAVPSFRPTLEELYPDRDPLTHLLRHLTLPVNSIWEKVWATYRKEFYTASKVVGMQVRYRDGPLMYRKLNDIVNSRIYSCALHNGLIPHPTAVMTSRRTMDNLEGPVIIFIASLYSGLQEHLQNVYSTLTEGSSRRLKLIQLSEVRYQSFETEADYQAFMEIICLSLADEIVTSPVSTFGQMAQGFGALTPWLLNFDPLVPTDCVRGQSYDACFQEPVDKFTCPLDQDLDGLAMVDMVPYLKACQDTVGLQLIPPWNTSQP